jgi:hypothetical protein
MFDAYLDDFICEITCEEYWGDWEEEEYWDDDYDPVPQTYDMIQDGRVWYAEVEATIDLDEWSDW